MRPISRRDALKWIAATGSLQLLDACVPRTRARDPGVFGGRRLARVNVSPERVIREVVGLRPFRRSGFLVRADSANEKLLIHNYGHGGGGVSLSWGSADLAAELALAQPARAAAVVGCGAVGLATARLLQDRGFGVTIYARDLPPNTTSNIAGAQWSPVTVVDSDRVTPQFETQFVRASRYAYRYFQTLVGARYGISWRENYFVSSPNRAPRSGPAQFESTALQDLLPRHPVPAGSHPFGDRAVSRMLTMHIEPSTYLAAVLQDFRVAGGRIVVGELADARAMLSVPEPLVVNCTGLAAGKLFDDPDVLPIKGQLTVLAPQPEVDYITIGPGDLYMMPRQDGIILGGTHERGEWSLEPNPAESQRILRGHQELFASMEL